MRSGSTPIPRDFRLLSHRILEGPEGTGAALAEISQSVGHAPVVSTATTAWPSSLHNPKHIGYQVWNRRGRKSKKNQINPVDSFPDLGSKTVASCDTWAENGEFYKDKAERLGYAKDVVYMPNDLYIDQMREAGPEAKTNKRGLWGAC